MCWPSDAALPRLPLLRDLEAVSAALPGWRATGRLHARYVPGRSCVATYDLEGEGGSGPVRSIGVASVEPTGLRARLYTSDPGLQGLAEVADGTAARQRLDLQGATVTPVRYRPEARCTLALGAGDGAVVAFAKVLTGVERVRDAVAVLDRAGVPVPAEVAWWPDLECLVQAAVPAPEPLGPLLAERADVAAAAGAALARIHATDARAWPGPVTRVPDDVGRLERLRSVVAAAVPEALSAYDGALATLRAAAERGAGAVAPPVPSHGSFRAGQLVLDGDGRVVVLDLDGACRAEPARDIGNFLAHLRWQAVRHPAEAPGLAAARESFLEGYRSVAPPADDRRVALHEAASLVKIAGRRARDLSTGEWPLLHGLLTTADRALRALERASGAGRRRALGG